MTPARRAPVIMDIFLYVPGSDEPLTSSARITAEGLEFIGLPESIDLAHQQCQAHMRRQLASKGILDPARVPA